MKPIRPLFRNNGRLGVPQLHGGLQSWVGDPHRGKHPQRPDTRRGTLKVKERKRPDGSRVFVGEPELRFLSIPGIVTWARARGTLREAETEFLRRFLIKTLSKPAYQEWLSSSGVAPFFLEPDWSNTENHRKYAVYAMACFVDFFRPGEIDWRTPDEGDMRLVAGLLDSLASAHSARQQRILIDGLFGSSYRLPKLNEAMAREVNRSPSLSKRDRELLVKSHKMRLRGLSRAEWLTKRGFEAFGMPPMQKYQQNRNSMRALLNRWTREVLDGIEP